MIQGYGIFVRKDGKFSVEQREHLRLYVDTVRGVYGIFSVCLDVMDDGHIVKGNYILGME